MIQLCLLSAAAGAAAAPGPNNNVPQWSITYNMSESTVVMPCNYTGLYDYDAYPQLAKFGLVDYDWSNAKKTWVDQSPMDCDGMLVKQAARNKAKNPTAKVFVYRNIVKALPWYTEVRALLQDQSMWGFFIPYADCRTATGEYVCKNNVTGAIDATANLYHDEEQTPGWTGGGNGGPDGVCHGDTKGNNVSGPTQSGACDCGDGVSCGEYLFNHLNGTQLTTWFTEEYIGGATYGLGNANVDGFYLDDNWGRPSPSEEAFPCSPRGTGKGRCVGFTKEDLAAMQKAWASNMEAVQTAIVAHKGFDWQNFHSIRTPQQGQCAGWMRSQCKSDSEVQTNAMQYGIGYQYNHDFSNGTLTQFGMDLGVFLATRGPYSWLGYGWMGCGCGWEHGGKMPCDIYQRPPALDLDYGVPAGLCKETAAGVFEREWSMSTVTVNCNSYTSEVHFK